MSDFKALAKHSTNYLFAIMATKALAFISIPVYTRLLSVYKNIIWRLAFNVAHYGDVESVVGRRIVF